jgi:hypothetical protein
MTTLKIKLSSKNTLKKVHKMSFFLYNLLLDKFESIDFKKIFKI